MKTYIVKRDGGAVRLYRLIEHFRRGDGTPVSASNSEIEPDESMRLRRHSPDGFEFGYSGSGPSQLALAILYDVARGRAPDPKELALSNYQDFKVDFVACRGIEEREWRVTEREVLRWLAKR